MAREVLVPVKAYSRRGPESVKAYLDLVQTASS